jgi:endonuclease/exonuclease/phosphatase family metal-dependent hydrolase
MEGIDYHMKLHLLTINVHKGFSLLNRRFTLPQLRKAIHATSSDIIFMQEVVGENIEKAAKHADWPERPQHEYVAEMIGFEHVYGKNVVYTAGHHGNAILSRFPILCSQRVDVSTNRLESRGFLYAKLKIPYHKPGVHCICVHLGLFPRSRKKQFRQLQEYIQRVVPGNEPLIVAGDFNERRKKESDGLETKLGMKDAGLEVHGKKMRTFPALMPVWPLDRIYLRDFKVAKVQVLNKGVWKHLSDHAGLYAEVEI